MRASDGTFDGVWSTPSSFVANKSVPTAVLEPQTPAISLPVDFSLSQNFPNPFNPVTKIRYNLPEAAQVRLTIYDIMGREIAVPVNGRVEKGLHEFALDGTSMTSGVYIYQLETLGFSFSRKMILLR
ncbi:MAG TPA: hypothetical protein DIT99_22165 [Candidatus Latescibacteria bacterium]|nr:hypothetical protein [Candidatus Latescibacterota bacterium]